jgi:scyllo-inositol 2-dehydrogenase (NADP+)
VPWLSDVDAVTIGTPPPTHVALARAALNAGKHVLMEKPMALAPAEAEDLREQAAREGLTLAIVHNFQFARSARVLRARIASGAFGTVTSVLALQLSHPLRRLPTWYEGLPFGLFYDESPHILYLIHSFAGEPTLTSATAVPSSSGNATPAIVSAQFDCNGVPASLYMNFEAPLSEWHFCVMSNQRFAAIDIFRDVLVEMPHDGGHLAADILRSSTISTLTHWLGVIRSGALLYRKQLLYGNDEVVRRFAVALRTGTSPEGISSEDGLRVLRLQHAVMAAAQHSAGRTVPRPAVT